jgi:hypothetical protein
MFILLHTNYLKSISSVLEIMVITAILVSLVVVVVAYFYVKNKATSAGSTKIVGSTLDGRKSFTSSMVLPESLNQDKGLTFSYTAWVRFDDFAYRYGEQKVVFIKGPEDMSSMCPGVFLDGTTNTLLVKIDTFGSRETIAIGNIPAQKWLHLGIVVDQDSVDVYVNGILRTHQTLAQLPRQNPSSVSVGVGGGFDGRIADLSYYNYYLGPSEIQANMGTPPSPNVTDTVASLPPYFDLSWWIGRK